MPGFLALADHEPERVRRVRRFLLWAASLVLLTGCAQAPIEARILFINVGKGDAALVMAGDQHYLIDAGPKDAWDHVAAALAHYRVRKLDGVFLTHGDGDHAGGLKKLAKSEIEVSAWYASDLYVDDGKDGHPAAEAAEERGQEPVYLSAGDSVGPFTVLGPLERDKDDDNNSLILMFESAGGKALLTGDMKLDEEETLLKSGRPLACGVLKIAHHGNSDATSDQLIEAADPQIAVVSTDSEERPDLPDARIEALLEARGIPLYSTWKSGGGILVTFEKPQLRVDSVSFPGAME